MGGPCWAARSGDHALRVVAAAYPMEATPPFRQEGRHRQQPSESCRPAGALVIRRTDAGKWYPVTVSNRRHPVCRTGALPTELTGRDGIGPSQMAWTIVLVDLSGIEPLASRLSTARSAAELQVRKQCGATRRGAEGGGEWEPLGKRPQMRRLPKGVRPGCGYGAAAVRCPPSAGAYYLRLEQPVGQRHSHDVRGFPSGGAGAGSVFRFHGESCDVMDGRRPGDRTLPNTLVQRHTGL